MQFLSDWTTNCGGKQFNHTVSGPQRGVPTVSHVLTHVLEASNVSQLAPPSLPTLLLSEWVLEHSALFFLQPPNTTFLLLHSLNNYYPLQSPITCWVKFPLIISSAPLLFFYFQTGLFDLKASPDTVGRCCRSAWESDYCVSLWGFLTNGALKQCWWL